MMGYATLSTTDGLNKALADAQANILGQHLSGARHDRHAVDALELDQR